MKNLLFSFLSKEKATRSLTSFFILTFLFIGLGINTAYSQAPFPINPFRTTWITTDGTITIPTNGTGYDYTVTWTNLTNATVGNGFVSNQTGNYTITGLENNSTYEIAISGDFPRFAMTFNERLKLRTIEEWGTNPWTSMERAFFGSANLTYNATDIPNLSGVTNMSFMFFECFAFDGNSTMNDWNTSTITDMSYVFANNWVFNQPIQNWNTDNVTTMRAMFDDAWAFNQPIQSWNTENVTNMSSMFGNANSFNQPIGSWNMQNVTDISYMFYDNEAFNQSLDNWNTESVENMNFTFAQNNIFNQPIGNWNTESVTNMSDMFAYAVVFNQDISNWSTENVVDMTRMFLNANSFNQPIGNWNTQNVTSMGAMFADATAFNQNLANWNISNITPSSNFLNGMGGMLNNSGLSTANYDATLIGWAAQTVNVGVNLGATGLTYCASEAARNTLTSAPNNWIITGDAQQCLPFRTTWITTDGTITIPTNGGTGYNYTVTWINLTNPTVGDGSASNQTGNYTLTGLENNSTYEIAISGDFPRFFMNNDERLKIRTIEEWGDIQWTSMSFAFQNCENLTYTATDLPNLANVTDMSGMFRGCTSFDGNATMNNWNISTITNMNSLFAVASSFNQNIGNWNTANVTDMTSVFNDAHAFNQDISNWNTANVTTMLQLFTNASSFNQDIGSWNTANVTNMSQMFQLTPFNQDISNWNTGNVTDMFSMFFNATAFNQDISNWNTANVTTMGGMFWGATSFNQNIGNWNTTNVTNMAGMFSLATAFNQNLGSWNIENVVQNTSFYGMHEMLDNSGLSTANYDATLTGWAAQNINTGIILGANGLTYCAAQAARNTLTSAPNNWIITGDIFSCPAPEINLQGNNTDIVDGSITTALLNDTDFGNVCNATTKTFTIQNTGTANLTVSSIAIFGTNASDFALGNFSTTFVISPFSNQTFTVTFNSALSGIGIKTAMIQIISNDFDENPYTFAIQATGLANNTNPVIPILADHTAQCEVTSLTPPTTTHDCAGIITGTTLQTFPITTQGTTLVEWIFDDGNGNVVTANQNIIITDTEIPIITLPANVTANTDTGLCSASNVTLGTATGTDNCGTVSFTNNAPTVFPVGLTNVVWTADDGNGNTATATQTVTVIAPVEINVRGNGNSIADGNSATTATNDTDFGNVLTTKTVIYTIENTGTQPLLISSITSNNPKFAISNVPTLISAAGSATFTVEFSSVSLGLETAIITITNNDCDELIYDFAIKATKVNTITPPPTGGGTTGGTGTGGTTGGTGTGGTTGGTGTTGAVNPNPDLSFTGTPNTFNANRLGLSWITNATISTFRLYRNNVLIRTFSGSSTEYSDANLAANTFYRYELIAIINGIASEPSIFEFWTAPNPPSIASVTDVCEEGVATVVLSSNENGTGSNYKVYTEENGGSPVASSDTTFFDLPSVNSQTDFYISAVGGESGKEGERRKITVRVQSIFESVILGGSTQNSCTNSLVLQAGYIINANSYTWFLDGNEVGTGQTFRATVEGSYEVRINKIVCEVLSEPVRVFLNQKPTAEIQESSTTQNSISFCESGTLNAISSGQNATYKWLLNGSTVGEEQNVVVSRSGTYTLLVSKNDCQVSTTINVTVAPRPQMPTLLATKDSVCFGVMARISVQNPQNGVAYNWLRNGSAISETGNSIEVNTAGNYTVELISNVENSCTPISEQIQLYCFEVSPT